MTKKKNILLVTGLLFILQVIVFQDYILPIQWGQVKVQGLACTCPDETVLNGQLYLRSVTPDSLKVYHLDYSEIYVTERPATDFDPMGVDEYIIRGQIIGKDQVDESSTWNPKFQVDTWRPVNIIIDLIVKGLLVIELIGLGLIVIIMET
ncbi:MAG: hypothetical protein ACI9JN_001358 [Bacteroidia bacterium]|jgi:hypothetical protein